MNQMFRLIYNFLVHKFFGDSGNIETKRSVTFYNLRLDSMVELKIDAKSFVALFKERYVLLSV